LFRFLKIPHLHQLP